MKHAIELYPIFRKRVWGRRSLAPFFSTAPNTEPIGEAWFTFTENSTCTGKNLGQLLSEEPELLGSGADPLHPGVCPILVKLLFTTERLSVQVHPDDAYAHEHHASLGKTEAWYVLQSDPPGEVAVGFREELSRERFGPAIQSGEIEQLLDWRKVEAGDVIFVPAGTVHAIGAGLTVCEVQENSDITYRLFDYGRPRELHIEHGAAVSHLRPHTHSAKPVPLGSGREELVSCDYFRMERLRPAQSFDISAELPTYVLAVCTKGQGAMDGQFCRAGQAWFIPADFGQATVRGDGMEWVLAYRHPEPLKNVSVN